MDAFNFERRVRKSVEVAPAERGDFGAAIENKDGTAIMDKATESASEPTLPIQMTPEVEGSGEFWEYLKSKIIARDAREIFDCLSDNMRGAAHGFGAFEKFYSGSEVLAHITELKLEPKILTENKVVYHGPVVTESGKSYPSTIVIGRGDGGWRVTEIDFEVIVGE